MGEAKRRKKLDPTFGKVRLHPKKQLPDFGSYLLDQSGDRFSIRAGKIEPGDGEI